MTYVPKVSFCPRHATVFSQYLPFCYQIDLVVVVQNWQFVPVDFCWECPDCTRSHLKEPKLHRNGFGHVVVRWEHHRRFLDLLQWILAVFDFWNRH
jgi:hypothetical protein